VWVDAGNGTMANLQLHVGLHQVDAVVLSHEHPDHWSDIEGFHVACAYVIERDNVPVYAPAGLRDNLYKKFKPVFDWHQVGDGDTGSAAPITGRRRWRCASKAGVARSGTRPTPDRAGRSNDWDRVSIWHCARPRSPRSTRAIRNT
jgi:ribonuclease BN (tRNA processing enzyme)